MKALFIGGTGTISAAIVRRLAKDPLWEVWLLNRGNRKSAVPAGVNEIICDISNEADAAAKLEGMEFDVVCEFIGFTLGQVERDYRLFKDKTNLPLVYHIFRKITFKKYCLHQASQTTFSYNPIFPTGDTLEK